MTRLDRESVTELLTELAHRLAHQDVAGRIYIVGGAAMALEWDSRRTTRDVDALLDPSTTIKQIAAELATERGLPAGWINDAVAPFVPPVDTRAGRLLARFGDLDIVIAPPEHVFAMKMAAFRHSDIADLRTLVSRLQLTDPDAVAAVCEDIYGTDGVVLPSHDDLLWQARVILV